MRLQKCSRSLKLLVFLNFRNSVLPRFPGTREFLNVTFFSEYHDVFEFPELLSTPENSGCPVFFEYHVFPGFLWDFSAPLKFSITCKVRISGYPRNLPMSERMIFYLPSPNLDNTPPTPPPVTPYPPYRPPLGKKTPLILVVIFY